VRFLFRVTLRRHDLAAKVWHIKEPQKLRPVLSPEEVKRVLTMATSLQAQLTLSCGNGGATSSALESAGSCPEQPSNKRYVGRDDRRRAFAVRSPARRRVDLAGAWFRSDMEVAARISILN
jgi:hypothetical protein